MSVCIKSEGMNDNGCSVMIYKKCYAQYYYAPVSNRPSSAMIKPQTDKRVPIVKPENTQTHSLAHNAFASFKTNSFHTPQAFRGEFRSLIRVWRRTMPIERNTRIARGGIAHAFQVSVRIMSDGDDGGCSVMIYKKLA